MGFEPTFTVMPGIEPALSRRRARLGPASQKVFSIPSDSLALSLAVSVPISEFLPL